VSDIGKSVSNGRRAETIKPYHNVLYVLEDDEGEGKPKAWKLKLAERYKLVAEQ
jgi:hypothetical protein